MPSFTVIRAQWEQDSPRLRAVRHAVFVVEQNIPEEKEWDLADGECRHVIAIDAEGQAIGTGRLDATGKIGRMAVLSTWRGRAVGRAILQLLLEIAREKGFLSVYLNAQQSAVGFYKRCGFIPVGDPFLEVDIPHLRMELEL